ncbi:unnamed protein product [Boreogadus saida]
MGADGLSTAAFLCWQKACPGAPGQAGTRRLLTTLTLHTTPSLLHQTGSCTSDHKGGVVGGAVPLRRTRAVCGTAGRDGNAPISDLTRETPTHTTEDATLPGIIKQTPGFLYGLVARTPHAAEPR